MLLWYLGNTCLIDVRLTHTYSYLLEIDTLRLLRVDPRYDRICCQVRVLLIRGTWPFDLGYEPLAPRYDGSSLPLKNGCLDRTWDQVADAEVCPIRIFK
jgi:hypothetical protein